MTALKDKIQNALDEGRILILGGQALLGVELRAVFEPRFQSLPKLSRLLILLALTLLVVTLGLLMAPGAYHQIVEKGEDTPSLHRFTTGMIGGGLLPLGIGLGLVLTVIAQPILGVAGGILLGILVTSTSLCFWYVFEFMKRKRQKRKHAGVKSGPPPEPTKLDEKIRHVLTETRVVLPGAQALLGFQFVTMLTTSFQELPVSSQMVHLASLLSVCFSTILLMTPAAYHRIVLEGEETEELHRLAGRFLLAAMLPLGLGMCGDLFVVTRQIAESTGFALALSAAILLLILGLWFGYTEYEKRLRENRS